MGTYVKKVFKIRTNRVQRSSNNWDESLVNKAKKKILSEVAELFKDQYRVAGSRVSYRFVREYEEAVVPNIDKSILIVLGGVFEKIGGQDESVGGGDQKVGSDNKR